MQHEDPQAAAEGELLLDPAVPAAAWPWGPVGEESTATTVIPSAGIEFRSLKISEVGVPTFRSRGSRDHDERLAIDPVEVALRLQRTPP